MVKPVAPYTLPDGSQVIPPAAAHLYEIKPILKPAPPLRPYPYWSPVNKPRPRPEWITPVEIPPCEDQHPYFSASGFKPPRIHRVVLGVLFAAWLFSYSVKYFQ